MKLAEQVLAHRPLAVERLLMPARFVEPDERRLMPRLRAFGPTGEAKTRSLVHPQPGGAVASAIVACFAIETPFYGEATRF